VPPSLVLPDCSGIGSFDELTLIRSSATIAMAQGRHSTEFGGTLVHFGTARGDHGGDRTNVVVGGPVWRGGEGGSGSGGVADGTRTSGHSSHTGRPRRHGGVTKFRGIIFQR
jgi:hypothetical protein